MISHSLSHSNGGFSFQRIEIKEIENENYNEIENPPLEILVFGSLVFILLVILWVCN